MLHKSNYNSPGILITAKFIFQTNDKRCTEEILEKEVIKRKELFPAVCLKMKKKGLYRTFPVYERQTKLLYLSFVFSMHFRINAPFSRERLFEGRLFDALR